MREFNGRVNDVGPLRRNGEPDLAFVFLRQTFCQFAPGFAAIA